MLREPSLAKEEERPDEQQPLLLEEGPTSPSTPQHGAALSRAIAIIRYIEAITGKRRMLAALARAALVFDEELHT